MSLEQLLEAYGYPVLFAGTFLEGETPLLVAGFLAHRGYLDLPLVMVVAFAGSFCADQIFFQVGRTRGRAFLERRPAWQSKVDRASGLLDRYGLPLVIGFRFLYGLRTVSPFVIGMSGFAPGRFVLLNFIGGVLWSVTFGLLGYTLGGLLMVFLEDVRQYELAVVGVIVLLSFGWWLAYRRRSRRQAV